MTNSSTEKLKLSCLFTHYNSANINNLIAMSSWEERHLPHLFVITNKEQRNLLSAPKIFLGMNGKELAMTYDFITFQ